GGDVAIVGCGALTDGVGGRARHQLAVEQAVADDTGYGRYLGRGQDAAAKELLRGMHAGAAERRLEGRCRDQAPASQPEPVARVGPQHRTALLRVEPAECGFVGLYTGTAMVDALVVIDGEPGNPVLFDRDAVLRQCS